jgi:hypothetical protein
MLFFSFGCNALHVDVDGCLSYRREYSPTYIYIKVNHHYTVNIVKLNFYCVGDKQKKIVPVEETVYVTTACSQILIIINMLLNLVVLNY